MVGKLKTNPSDLVFPSPHVLRPKLIHRAKSARCRRVTIEDGKAVCLGALCTPGLLAFRVIAPNVRAAAPSILRQQARCFPHRQAPQGFSSPAARIRMDGIAAIGGRRMILAMD